MYCPACTSECFNAAPNNCPGIDFTCPECSLAVQLKSRSMPFGDRIVDAGHEAMIRAIRSEQVPNLFILRYSAKWFVSDLFLIPGFFFSESAVDKRKTLSVTARRAGWHSLRASVHTGKGMSLSLFGFGWASLRWQSRS
jgi:type II restriction enzyme